LLKNNGNRMPSQTNPWQYYRLCSSPSYTESQLHECISIIRNTVLSFDKQ